MPVVRFPALMKFYVDNQSEIFVAGATVSELLDNILARYPALETHLFDSNGDLRRHFNIFVNGAHLRELNGLDTVLDEDDKVILMASAAGGNFSIDKFGKIRKITDIYHETHEHI
jgi:molybdopterin synthase sulfur carrier subunit